MSEKQRVDLVNRFLSRKLWAYVIGVAASVAYAVGLIDREGLAAIVAASAAYQLGEGLADFGASGKRAESDARVAVVAVEADVELAKVEAFAVQRPNDIA